LKKFELLQKFQHRIPSILGSESYAKYAVLLPLIETKDGLSILFEVRAAGLRRQPGEICFPGGKCDPSDRDELHTAIRETSEELGISESGVTHTFPLDYMLSPFGTIIYPFAGMISEENKLRPNTDEVGEIFTVPLDYLLKTKPDRYRVEFKIEPEEKFPFDLIAGGENYNWQTRQMDEYFYFFENRVIWGLTARILKHFLELIREEKHTSSS